MSQKNKPNVLNRCISIFVDHPQEAGETYVQHMLFTLGMSVRFLFLSAIIAIHGIFPFAFTHTASSRIERINLILKQRSEKWQQYKALKQQK